MSTTPNTEAETAETPDLGDAGKKALADERAARKAAEQRAQAAEQKLAEIEGQQLRATVAAAKGLTDAQAARLTGSTREELAADADALLEAFKPAEEEPSYSPRRSPIERLRPGAAPSAQPSPSMGDVAGAVLA